MSYDVWLTIDTGGPEPAQITESRNMTSNVAPIWRAAGCDVAGFEGLLAGECLAALYAGVRWIRANPELAAAHLRGDGSWGSVEGAAEYLEALRAEFEAHPKATVHVCR